MTDIPAIVDRSSDHLTMIIVAGYFLSLIVGRIFLAMLPDDA